MKIRVQCNKDEKIETLSLKGKWEVIEGKYLNRIRDESGLDHFFGSQQAYNKYQQYLQQKSLTDEQETTAQMYSDPMWNWGAWGPWGMGYGFAYGSGMGWCMRS